MKFTVNVTIAEEYLNVLMAYRTGTSLDSEYFEMLDLQDIERDMIGNGLLEGGFYDHYPLSPTHKGSMIIDMYISNNLEIL